MLQLERDLALSWLGLLDHLLGLMAGEGGQSGEKPYLPGLKGHCPEVVTAPRGPETLWQGRVEQKGLWLELFID